MKKGGKLEAWGSPNGDENGRISWTFHAPPPRTPPRDDLGKVLGGFGGPFGTVLGWFGSPGVVQMDMKIDTFRGKPRSPPQDMPRKALGRVLGRFGDFWGRF